MSHKRQTDDKTLTFRQDDKTPALRLDPEKRLCPEYDAVSVKRYRAPAPDKMGFRVLDNFCEEHIQ